MKLALFIALLVCIPGCVMTGNVQYHDIKGEFYMRQPESTDPQTLATEEPPKHIEQVQVPSDIAAPVVTLNSVTGATAIAAPRQIVATIFDSSLTGWHLQIAPRNSAAFTTLASGLTQPHKAVIFTLDPASLANGFYTLRLVATDTANHISSTTIEIEINSIKKIAGAQ